MLRLEARNLPGRLLAAAAFFQTFSLLLDLACPQSLYLPEISSLLLAAALLFRAVRNPRPRLRPLLCAPALLSAAYVALDMLSFLRGDAAAFREKYRVTAVCALNAAGLSIALADGALALRMIYLALYASGMSAGAAALADRFWLNFSQTQYTVRITLRNDYNMYATVLLCAAIGGLGLLLSGPRSPWRYAAFFASSAFLGGMAYLSGSRRIFMAQLPAGLISVFAAVRSCTVSSAPAEKPSQRMQKPGKSPVRDAPCLAAAVLSAVAFTLAAALIAPKLPALLESRAEAADCAPSRDETTLAERYESLGHGEGGGAFETRRVLWSAALDEIKRAQLSHPAALLFGLGGGYDVTLYDRLLQSGDERLGETFGDGEKYLGKLSAHNFLLSDILCGGLVKTSVCAALWASLAISALRAVRRDICGGLPCAMLLAVAFVNSFISNRYGFLYDRCFWIALAAVIRLSTETLAGGGGFCSRKPET